jgi:hypothetical protein
MNDIPGHATIKLSNLQRSAFRNLLNLDLPDEITIRIHGDLREGMQRVADLYRHESETDLIELVLRRGIAAMLGEQRHQPSSPSEPAQKTNAAKQGARERHATRLARDSKLTLLAQRADPRHVPFGMKRTIEQQRAFDAEYDRERARIKRDLGLADFPEGEAEKHRGESASPHIERYLGLPVGERLRQDLEDAFSKHDGLSEEIFLASLLDLGLQALHEKPDAIDPRKVKDDLRTWVKAARRQKFKAEWKALCNMVARGYR